MACSRVILIVVFFSLLPLISSEDCECKGEKTYMRLFLHRILSGPNATTITVVKPDNTSHGFGTITAVDHELRTGPETASKLLARAQGSAIEASLSESHDLLVEGNIVFVAGKYNGSTISLFGRQVENGTSVFSIIGGTYEFMMAKGHILRTPLGSCTSDRDVLLFEISVVRCWSGFGPKILVEEDLDEDRKTD